MKHPGKYFRNKIAENTEDAIIIDERREELFDLEHHIGVRIDTPAYYFKAFIWGALLFIVLVATASKGLPFAIAVFFVLGPLCMVADKYLRDEMKLEVLKVYATRTENIYEMSMYPDRPDRYVFKRAEEHRLWLSASENQLGVIVYELYFQDACNPNENWSEFLERVKDFIIEDRKKRHTLMSGKDREKYIKYFLGQAM